MLRLAAACSCALALAPQAMPAQTAAVIHFSDAHLHLNDLALSVRLMDQLGVDRAIVLAGHNIGNVQLLEAARRWPGRLFPFLSVSPEHREFRAAWEADDARLNPMIDSALAAGGYFGIGEISVTHFPSQGFPEADFDPNGRTMRGLLLAARKYRLPIMMHVEITRLRELEAVLAAFRDVTIIWAHGGYTQLFLAQRLLDAHPNLIYELSARTWARHPRSPDYTIFENETTVWAEWVALIEAKPTRFIVGTDAAGRSEERDRANLDRVRLLLRQLSPETQRLVARANLDRLLHLSTDAGH